MKQLTCEMCGSTDVIKQNGVFVCQSCGTKYSVEEAKRMIFEGAIEVQGTVKVDNSAFVEKYLANARRAKQKEDWEEVEKYYNMVEQNAPENIEAVFYSSYAKARSSLQSDDYFKQKASFEVLGNSISIIDDYFAKSNSTSQIELIKQMSEDLMTILNLSFGIHSDFMKPLLKNVNEKFIESLEHIINNNPEIAADLMPCLDLHKSKVKKGCYIATAVYGSYDCPQVWTLRRFRDHTLAETWYGRVFIHIYYAISPTIVKWFGHTEWFKKIWKDKLDRMVAKLNASGIESTPYEDRRW